LALAAALLEQAQLAAALFPVAQISYSLYLVHEMFMLWLFPKPARLLGASLEKIMWAPMKTSSPVS